MTEQTITGLIISTNLSQLGDMTYGFIGVETENHQSIKVKIAAFTKYDTLDVGAHVRIVGEVFEKDGLLSAKSITRLS